MQSLRCTVAAIVSAVVMGPVTHANQPGHASPVYQRYGYGSYSGAKYGHGDSARGSFYARRKVLPWPQQAQSFQFQRPYPYHLDYYRMRYGGSYAPYFGNLYGPPQVYAPSNLYGGYPVPYGSPSAYPQPPMEMSAPVYGPAPAAPQPEEPQTRGES